MAHLVPLFAQALQYVRAPIAAFIGGMQFQHCGIELLVGASPLF